MIKREVMRKWVRWEGRARAQLVYIEVGGWMDNSIHALETQATAPIRAHTSHTDLSFFILQCEVSEESDEWCDESLGRGGESLRHEKKHEKRSEKYFALWMKQQPQSRARTRSNCQLAPTLW
jgi:hypothetical protein